MPLDRSIKLVDQAYQAVQPIQFYWQSIEAEVEWVYFLRKSLVGDAGWLSEQFVRLDSHGSVRCETNGEMAPNRLGEF